MEMIKVESVRIANGEKIGYRESGTGERVLLLIHGNMTSSKHMEILMSNFPEGYHIYAVDLRGFGNSTYNNRISSIKEFSDDIKLFADELKLLKFSIAGWSLGGAVAMQFAADCPTWINKLILIESVGLTGYQMMKRDQEGAPIPEQPLRTKEEIAADPVQVAPVLSAYATKNKEYLKNLWNSVIYTNATPPPELYDEYLNDMLTQRNLVDVDYALTYFNLSDEHNGVIDGSGAVRRIVAPTLVLHGDRDKIIEPSIAEKTASAIGNNARFICLKDCGHSPFIDSLDVLISYITEFMDADVSQNLIRS